MSMVYVPFQSVKYICSVFDIVHVFMDTIAFIKFEMVNNIEMVSKHVMITCTSKPNELK